MRVRDLLILLSQPILIACQEPSPPAPRSTPPSVPVVPAFVPPLPERDGPAAVTVPGNQGTLTCGCDADPKLATTSALEDRQAVVSAIRKLGDDLCDPRDWGLPDQIANRPSGEGVTRAVEDCATRTGLTNFSLGVASNECQRGNCRLGIAVHQFGSRRLVRVTQTWVADYEVELLAVEGGRVTTVAARYYPYVSPECMNENLRLERDWFARFNSGNMGDAILPINGKWESPWNDLPYELRRFICVM